MNFRLDTGCPDCGLVWVYNFTAENAGRRVPDHFLKFTVHNHSLVSWHTVIVSDDMVS